MDPLTKEQKEEFIANGYLIIKNVIPQEVIQNAMRRINHAIGTPDYTTQVCKGDERECTSKSVNILVGREGRFQYKRAFK